MNTFGNIFRVTTFGESHGNAVGAVIDGVPSMLDFILDDLKNELEKRRPGGKFASSRNEKDIPEVLSGIFENKTLGSPICVIVRNENQNSRDYNELKNLFRPNHADYTYQQKYGFRDHRGGGRASARETLARVIGGYFANLILKKYFPDLEILVAVTSLGKINSKDVSEMSYERIYSSEVRCDDAVAEKKIKSQIMKLKKAGDSMGGVISCCVKNMPVGLGEPIYYKLSSVLANAMMSINGAVGFEYGLGFKAALNLGSMNNDEYIFSQNKNKKSKNIDKIITTKNNSGGIQGGISNGNNLTFRVAFKPPSSIAKEQDLLSTSGEIVKTNIQGRHDPTIVVRAVPVVEAMLKIVLADLTLQNSLYKTC